MSSQRDENQPVKVRDVIKLIEADGWYFLRQRGSHRQYRHATKPGKVTVAGKPSEEMAPGTLGSIFRQAGIDQDEEKEEDQ
jgi:predicted RNA binding protein YcfA (HicA-like mRNA interferase family)